MSDPVTPNVGCYIPAHSSDVGSWDQPCNANFFVTDSLAANVASIGLTDAPITLTTPPNSGASWSGPYQSQSALLRFSGTITANIVVTIPRAGFYIVENLCAGINTYYVQLTTGAGNAIGAIPGKKCHVFSDGTNMDYVDLPDPGQAYDLHGYTSLPVWMSACTINPYLIKDGASYATSAYPNLFNVIGYTYGGSGANFNVPDERARMRVGYDSSTNSGPTNRITNAISGVAGATMGSAGGAQALSSANQLPLVTPTFTGNALAGGASIASAPSKSAQIGSSINAPTSFVAITPTGTISPIGSATPSGDLPPCIVSILALIKT